MLLLIKRFLEKNPRIRFFIKNILGRGIVENYFATDFEKNCLIMYVVSAFFPDAEDFSHQAYWQQKEIARILSDKGYNIDVIDYNNNVILLKKNYDLVIDLIPGKNNVFKKHMNPNCKTIAYLTGSNATFQNEAEKSRLDDLMKRRGVSLLPRRQSPYITKEIEKYTACFMIGNEYNWNTYLQEFDLGKPYYIKNTGHVQKFEFDEKIKQSNAFLYFGSAGQVHKGLDLLLEIFSEDNFPAELYVCGSYPNETDFEKCYWHELYETKNIHPIGFVNITSDLFTEFTNKCSYSIMPSCSEGLAGSVLTTMSAGLINICSRECGLEADEVIILDDCKKETIRKFILEYSQKNIEWIKKESIHSYNIVNERYSKECFIRSIKEAFEAVL